MALPTKTTLQGMSFSKNGTPWVRVESKSGQVANGLSFSKDGSPFWFMVASALGVTNMKVNIGGVWKDVVSVQINIGGVWKDVVAIQQNIGDVWKNVF